MFRVLYWKFFLCVGLRLVVFSDFIYGDFQGNFIVDVWSGKFSVVIYLSIIKFLCGIEIKYI